MHDIDFFQYILTLIIVIVFLITVFVPVSNTDGLKELYLLTGTIMGFWFRGVGSQRLSATSLNDIAKTVTQEVQKVMK